MNRIEIIELFTAMKRLYENKDLDGLGEVIEEVLAAAKAYEKAGECFRR